MDIHVYFEREFNDDFGDCVVMETVSTQSWFRLGDTVVSLCGEKNVIWDTKNKDDGVYKFSSKEKTFYVPICDVLYFV